MKLSYADTVAALLSVGVEDHASIAAAKAKDASRVDKAEAAEDKAAKDASRGSFDKAFKTFTRGSTDKKRADGSFTLQSAVNIHNYHIIYAFSIFIYSHTYTYCVFSVCYRSVICVLFSLELTHGHKELVQLLQWLRY